MLKSVYCLLFFLFTVSPNTELPDSKLAKDVRGSDVRIFVLRDLS